MFDFNLTTELFALLFGAGVSIFFSWMPYVRLWFAKLNDEEKQLTMLLFALATAGFIGISSCIPLWTYISCDKFGMMKLVSTFFAFILANQGIFMVTPKARDVKIVKEGEMYTG